MIYKKHLNKLTYIKNLAKRQYYENLIKNKRGNSRETWAIIFTIIDYKTTKNKSKIPLTMEINNQVYDTNSDIFLNILCDYFASIGSLISKNVTNQHNSYLEINSKRICQSFVFHKITEDEVNSCINNIKTYSAPGIDSIAPKFIKLSKVVFAPFLTKFFNKCTGNFSRKL